MIDMHSHIIFDVDDGPKDQEAARQLLAESYRQGVRTIIATSHRRKGMFDTPEDKIWEHFQTVRELAARVAPDLQLYYGAEIYYSSDAQEKLEEERIPTLAGSQYVLIEFSMAAPYREIYRALANVLRLGLTPVLAHIERYHCLENAAEKVEELIQMGCYMQVNSASVLKPKLFGDKYKFMKKRAQYFLDRDLVHFIASDMHSLDRRPPHMREAYDLIAGKYGPRRAQTLFQDNQELLLKKEQI